MIAALLLKRWTEQWFDQRRCHDRGHWIPGERESSWPYGPFKGMPLRRTQSSNSATARSASRYRPSSSIGSAGAVGTNCWSTRACISSLVPLAVVKRHPCGGSSCAGHTVHSFPALMMIPNVARLLIRMEGENTGRLPEYVGTSWQGPLLSNRPRGAAWTHRVDLLAVRRCASATRRSLT